MSSDGQGRGRTKPEDSDDDDWELDDLITFSEKAEGKFRSRVNQYSGQDQTQFPRAPLFTVGEVVYLIVSGQSQPAGPFEVESVNVDGYYRIKRMDNGQLHNDPVDESRLVIRHS
ncbi:hypothetical protein F5X99DRAFT_403213 [Biscogniauxia marginata]|nr:hypothetical protein F5X99DRAFT_403213 [Biscogniauxia marginata]